MKWLRRVIALLCIERRNPMNEAKIERSEDEVLSYEVSDESLETAAAAAKAGAYTLGFCTGLSTCPAP
jgi:hypothetical protein